MQFDIGPNLETLLLALLAALPGIIAAFYARRGASAAQANGRLLNGHVDALVAAAHAQGVLAGQAAPDVPPAVLAPPGRPAIGAGG